MNQCQRALKAVDEFTFEASHAVSATPPVGLISVIEIRSLSASTSIATRQ